MRGKVGKAGLVTLVDRRSRYLIAERVPKVNSSFVAKAVIAGLSVLPNGRVRTLTPDRGTEFAKYAEIASVLKASLYFPDPHAPQQRGSNENTNGLIREYFPRNTDLDLLTGQEIRDFIDQLNNRPRKVFGWKTRSEVFFGKKLHLI